MFSWWLHIETLGHTSSCLETKGNQSAVTEDGPYYRPTGCCKGQITLTQLVIKQSIFSIDHWLCLCFCLTCQTFFLLFFTHHWCLISDVATTVLFKFIFACTLRCFAFIITRQDLTNASDPDAFVLHYHEGQTRQDLRICFKRVSSGFDVFITHT